MNQTFIQIEGRKIGPEFDPIVIAELGINHNGDLNIAKEMVRAAHEAGVEIIKHQTHVVEDEMSLEAKEIVPGNSDKSIYQIMHECALNEDDEVELKRYIESFGMIFLSTPFSRSAIDRLVRMNVSAFKIGSGECNNYPLLKYLASFGKPIIMSTGMNNLKDIEKSVKIFRDNKVEFALLHTTNLYPTPNHLVRLGGMESLANHFPNVPFGLSDHTVTNHACFGAVALGASILERHFTDHMNRLGPDIVCSMDATACKELIEGAKIIKQQRGGDKKPADEEKVTIDFAFASVVATKNLEKGDILSEENIWVKRPGKGGIPAENYEDLLGKRVNASIAKNTQVKWGHLD